MRTFLRSLVKVPASVKSLGTGAPKNFTANLQPGITARGACAGRRWARGALAPLESPRPGQVDDQAADVGLRVAEPPDRDAGHRGGRPPARVVGGDRADDVDPDVVRPPLDGRVLGEAADRLLGGGVGALALDAALGAGRGAEVDHRAAAARLHVRVAD